MVPMRTVPCSCSGGAFGAFDCVADAVEAICDLSLAELTNTSGFGTVTECSAGSSVSLLRRRDIQDMKSGVPPPRSSIPTLIH